MSIEKLIESTLSETTLKHRDIKNHISFRVGDTLTNDEGASFSIIDIYAKASPRGPTTFIEYKFKVEDKSGKELKTIVSFLNTYFGFNYKE